MARERIARTHMRSAEQYVTHFLLLQRQRSICRAVTIAKSAFDSAVHEFSARAMPNRVLSMQPRIDHAIVAGMPVAADGYLCIYNYRTAL